MSTLLEFISRNFTHVAPILGAGAFALVIILERVHALVWDYSFPYADAFFEKVRYMVLSDRIGEAIAFCEQLVSKPVVRVVREGLVRAHQPESVIEHGLQIAVAEVAAKIQARTQFLSTIANVATLLGLLGTIMGLVQSFDAVGNANAQERAALLAAGISTAMNATMLGLAVAIPCMIAYSFLVNRTNRLIGEIDLAAIKMLDLLKQRYYALETGPEYPTSQPTGTSGGGHGGGMSSGGGGGTSVPLQTRVTRTGRSRGGL